MFIYGGEVKDMTVLRGTCVEILFADYGNGAISEDALVRYHRSRPRTGLDDWREGSDESEYPRLWTEQSNGLIPHRIHEYLLAFDQRGGDIELEAWAATCITGKIVEQEQRSLVGGIFIIRQSTRVVASPWRLAWWDELRTTTSYAAPFEMIRRIRRGRYGS